MQLSAALHGGNRERCRSSLKKARARAAARGEAWSSRNGRPQGNGSGGHGGHFRAVQGFRYWDREEVDRRIESGEGSDSATMKIYLCGQKAFGAATLSLLLNLGHQVVGVSAPLRRADGREDRLALDARMRALPMLPAGELREALLPDGVDLIVCAHSHDFVGRATREKARLGAIG